MSTYILQVFSPGLPADSFLPQTTRTISLQSGMTQADITAAFQAELTAWQNTDPVRYTIYKNSVLDFRQVPDQFTIFNVATPSEALDFVSSQFILDSNLDA